MYLYLKQEGRFDLLPEELMRRFGLPERVMQLELCPQRELAREDVKAVLQILQTRGFHLQLPPQRG